MDRNRPSYKSRPPMERETHEQYRSDAAISRSRRFLGQDALRLSAPPRARGSPNLIANMMGLKPVELIYCKLGSKTAVSFLDSWLKTRNENQFVPLGDIKVDFLIKVTYLCEA
ncbi:hypothetical protein HZ326_20792 [Fusarium oxysporum f. sp. albedinis]|nr:hypothetical protein HZ326_20792 [Fusarium oxysporum f. sp. albedinis]